MGRFISDFFFFFSSVQGISHSNLITEITSRYLPNSVAHWTVPSAALLYTPCHPSHLLVSRPHYHHIYTLTKVPRTRLSQPAQHTQQSIYFVFFAGSRSNFYFCVFLVLEFVLGFGLSRVRGVGDIGDIVWSVMGLFVKLKPRFFGPKC